MFYRFIFDEQFGIYRCENWQGRICSKNDRPDFDLLRLQGWIASKNWWTCKVRAPHKPNTKFISTIKRNINRGRRSWYQISFGNQMTNSNSCPKPLAQLGWAKSSALKRRQTKKCFDFWPPWRCLCPQCNNMLAEPNYPLRQAHIFQRNRTRTLSRLSAIRLPYRLLQGTINSYLYWTNMNGGSNFYRAFDRIDYETIDYIYSANALWNKSRSEHADQTSAIME